MARVRVHQHVNPLAKYYRELPVKPLNLKDVFGDPEMPLHLDIGCGRGRFLLQLAKQQTDWNYLGIDIREPIVIQANEIRDTQKLKNLHYEFCNATLDLETLLENVPSDILKFVTIQFPDPWFKKRHAKRRMVKDNLVETISAKLAEEGEILVQTDVEFLAEEMFELFEQHKLLIPIGIDENPLAVKTEREISVENRDLPIYRRIFEKKSGKR
ncbi:MAG: tRNA (guanosine(46)-N7)-methyltransferase TrmB [Pyrinomonadaceae bacterium]|nr:tRNA (guanosine(46)-N7)-methyltransferase TrmB [Pyrinomonadaceae bacterium]